MAQYRPPQGSTPRARRLRKLPTDAEQRMRRILRTCYPDAHFRHQVPLRNFIADFASHQLKLVVEVDGGQRGGAEDDERTAPIEGEGYRVVRFWNNDVLTNGDGIAQVLATYCGDATPTHEQVRVAPRPEAMSGGHGDLLISPIKGEGFSGQPGS